MCKKISIGLLFLISQHCAGSVDLTKAIELKFASHIPPSYQGTIYCVDPWLRQIENATSGIISIKAFHGQSLVTGKDI